MYIVIFKNCFKNNIKWKSNFKIIKYKIQLTYYSVYLITGITIEH